MRIVTDKAFPDRECPGCAMVVPGNNNRCPICGYEFPHAPVWRRPLLAVVAVLLLVTLLFWLL